MTISTQAVVSLDEAKNALRSSLSKTTPDEEIEADINGLSLMFDRRYGASVRRTVTAEQVDLDHNCRTLLNLWPIVGSPTGDAGTITVKNRRFAKIESTDATTAAVAYEAGRADDTDSVDADFKGAFLIALKNWRAGSTMSAQGNPGDGYVTPRSAFPTFAFPRACDQALTDYRRHRSG